MLGSALKLNIFNLLCMGEFRELDPLANYTEIGCEIDKVHFISGSAGLHARARGVLTFNIWREHMQLR